MSGNFKKRVKITIIKGKNPNDLNDCGKYSVHTPQKWFAHDSK